MLVADYTPKQVKNIPSYQDKECVAGRELFSINLEEASTYYENSEDSNIRPC